MRGSILLAGLLALSACGGETGAAPEASEKAAIDRSVDAVAAAEAAASAPMPVYVAPVEKDEPAKEEKAKK